MPHYESGPRFDTKYLNLQGTHTQLSKHVVSPPVIDMDNI
jgi:hypothetical protein